MLDIITRKENRSSEFPTRSDTNRPVKSQKKARLLDISRRENVVPV